MRSRGPRSLGGTPCSPQAGLLVFLFSWAWAYLQPLCKKDTLLVSPGKDCLSHPHRREAALAVSSR